MIQGDIMKMNFSKKKNENKKKIAYMNGEIDILTKKLKKKEKKIENLEEQIFKVESEKYRALDSVAAIECDLTIKDAELRRMGMRNKTLSNDITKLMNWRTKQKEKNKNFENFVKKLKYNFEEIIRYKDSRIKATEALLSKIVYKLTIGQEIDFEEFEEKINRKKEGISLKPIGLDDKMTRKIFKQSPGEFFKCKLEEIQRPDFEKLDRAFYKLLDSMQNKGFEVSQCDISELGSTQKSFAFTSFVADKKDQMIQSFDDSCSLNDSTNNFDNIYGNNMILKDLENDNYNLSTRESSIAGIIENISDVKCKLKSPSIVYNAKSGHVENLIESVKDLVEVLKITAKNLVTARLETSGFVKEDRAAKDYSHIVTRSKSFQPSVDINFLMADSGVILDTDKVDDLLNEIKHLKEIVKEKQDEEKRSILSVLDIKRLENAVMRMDSYEGKVNAVDFEQLTLHKKIQKMEIYLNGNEEGLKDKQIELEKMKIQITEYKIRNEEMIKKMLRVENEKSEQGEILLRLKREHLSLKSSYKKITNELKSIRLRIQKSSFSTSNLKGDIAIQEEKILSAKNEMEGLKNEKEKLKSKLEEIVASRDEIVMMKFKQDIEFWIQKEKTMIMKDLEIQEFDKKMTISTPKKELQFSNVKETSSRSRKNTEEMKIQNNSNHSKNSADSYKLKYSEKFHLKYNLLSQLDSYKGKIEAISSKIRKKYKNVKMKTNLKNSQMDMMRLFLKSLETIFRIFKISFFLFSKETSLNEHFNGSINIFNAIDDHFYLEKILKIEKFSKKKEVNELIFGYLKMAEQRLDLIDTKI